MTVKELIEALQKCRNQDAKAYLWVEGGRMELTMVDDWCDDQSLVDINAEERSE